MPEEARIGTQKIRVIARGTLFTQQKGQPEQASILELLWPWNIVPSEVAPPSHGGERRLMPGITVGKLTDSQWTGWRSAD